MAKTKNSRKTGSKRNSNTNNPSSSVIVYRGPIVPKVSSQSEDAVVEILTYATTVSGGSVGVQYYVGTNPSSATGWSSFASRYDEYRVLGMELVYLPHYPGGNATVVQSAGLGVSTHNATNPFPFTSISQMAGYDDWKPFNTGQVFRLDWRMASTEESQYYPTGSPGQVGYLGLFGPNATSSGVYGQVYTIYRVQFRGRT